MTTPNYTLDKMDHTIPNIKDEDGLLQGLSLAINTEDGFLIQPRYGCLPLPRSYTHDNPLQGSSMAH